jgi:hypothetical protein
MGKKCFLLQVPLVNWKKLSFVNNQHRTVEIHPDNLLVWCSATVNYMYSQVENFSMSIS